MYLDRYLWLKDAHCGKISQEINENSKKKERLKKWCISTNVWPFLNFQGFKIYFCNHVLFDKSIWKQYKYIPNNKKL